MGRPLRFSLSMGHSHRHPADPCQTMPHGFEAAGCAARCRSPEFWPDPHRCARNGVRLRSQRQQSRPGFTQSHPPPRGQSNPRPRPRDLFGPPWPESQNFRRNSRGLPRACAYLLPRPRGINRGLARQSVCRPRGRRRSLPRARTLRPRARKIPRGRSGRPLLIPPPTMQNLDLLGLSPIAAGIVQLLTYCLVAVLWAVAIADWLTADQRRQVQLLRIAGHSQAAIGRRLGLSPYHVRKLLK